MLMPLGLSAHDFEVGGIYYNITSAEDKTVAVTFSGKYYDTVDDEYTGEVAIPATVTHGGVTYRVTSIGSRAFRSCKGLTSITIPKGVTSIGSHAFYFCTGLTSITLPESVISIGEYAFRNCTSLASITLPKGVTSIGVYAFYYCTSLTSLTIPKGVTSIGEDAFHGCTSLTSVTFSEDSQLTSIGSNAFYECSGLTSITLPEGVTSIGYQAFERCTSLTSITIPSSVTSIGNSAFSNCTSLTSITIPEGVTSIGDDTFWSCTSLASITLPSSVTSIGEDAFYNCTSLTSITIPKSVTSIGDRTFNNCTSLTSITLPEGVTSLGDDAFSNCTSLTSITIPSSVTSIGSSAFSNCPSLTSITIPKSVTSIGDKAFYKCVFLRSNFINNSKCSDATNWGALIYTEEEEVDGMIIQNNVLVAARENLTIANIPEGVTSIGNEAFYYCTNLTSIIIPSSVTSIGDDAFNNCTSLTSITLPEGVTSIGSSAFERCTSLTSITLPESVTSIGSRAFYGCTSLASITLPEGVTSIGGSAFNGCTGLTSITIPKGVTSIGDGTFSGCTGLTSITLPEGVTSIGSSAFYDCSGLTSITIPSSLTSIGWNAFSDCTSLTDVCYLGSAEQWKAIEISTNNESLTDATLHYYDANGFCIAHEGDDNYMPAPLNAEGYYEIANGGQLFWFAQQVNEGGEGGRYLKAVLKNDIDLKGRSWTPIGKTGGTDSQSFRGVFDGNGNTIRGLYVDTLRSALGLFGEVRKGVVKDFTIYGEVKLNGKYNYVGGVIGSACGIQGDNGSTISGITSYVNVTLGEGSHGSNHVAGLIGYVNHNTTVERCTWLGTLDLDAYRAQDGVGGLIGKANAQCVGTIRDCAAYGTIRTAYKSESYVNPSDSQPFTNIFIGGIVSNSLAGATTNIENCIWAGNIVNETDLGKNNAHIAAIGTLNGVGNVANCYYLEGSAPYVTTHNAYNNGKIFGVSPEQLVSGEIAAKLGEAWGQNIDGEGAKDAKPVVGGAKVHYGYLTCDENASKAYTNNAEASEVRPEHNHVDGFCTVCRHIDAEDGIVIRDGQHTAFAITNDIDVASITYTRTLPNQEWNSLYVPFGIEVTDELLEDYEVAYMNNMHTYDTDDDGSIDQMEMEIIKIKQGTLKANYPYFIRAKHEEAKNMNLVIEDATLEATVKNTVSCQSVRNVFELRGIYTRLEQADFAQLHGTHYAISTEGGWWQTAGLNPFRAYLTIIPRSETPVDAPALRCIGIRVKGEGTTGIEHPETDNHSSASVYDLMGRRVMEPQKGGVYVVNGKKVVIK